MIINKLVFESGEEEGYGYLTRELKHQENYVHYVIGSGRLRNFTSDRLLTVAIF